MAITFPSMRDNVKTNLSKKTFFTAAGFVYEQPIVIIYSCDVVLCCCADVTLSRKRFDFSLTTNMYAVCAKYTVPAPPPPPPVPIPLNTTIYFVGADPGCGSIATCTTKNMV